MVYVETTALEDENLVGNNSSQALVNETSLAGLRKAEYLQGL